MVLENCVASVPVKLMAFDGPFVNSRVSVPGLLMVMVCAALVELMRRSANERLWGVTLIEPAAPAPLRVTVVGLPTPLCEIAKLAVFPPVALGEKFTLIVQLTFGASAVEQLFVCANCVLSDPVTETLLTVRFAVPVLVIVTACDPLLVFTV